MDNGKILHFIADKIDDLKEAIFYCQSTSVLRIHNTIIHSSKLDETGCITFFLHRPQQLINQFEQEFPVALHYFRKGKSYFLKIHGKARIINDPEDLAYEDLTPEQINAALTTLLLVKVKMSKVDFYDNEYERKNLLLKKAVSVFSWIFDSLGAASRSYDLSRRPALSTFGFR